MPSDTLASTHALGVELSDEMDPSSNKDNQQVSNQYMRMDQAQVTFGLNSAHSEGSELFMSPQAQLIGTFELVELIFSFFDSPIEVKGSRKTLLNAALTCKAFFNPAMDILWSSIDSWTALLKLIPKVQYLPSGGMRTNLFTTTDVLDEDDLQRLCLYSQRVKCIRFSNFTEFVSTHIYSSIKHLSPNNIFPNLAKLHIDDIGGLYMDNLNGLSIIPSPSLFSLHIGGITPPTEAKYISDVTLLGQFSNIILKRLADFTMLEILFLQIQTAALDIDFILETCSTLTKLKHFTLSLNAQLSMTNAHSKRPFVFDALQKVLLSGSAFCISYVLQVMRSVKLEKVGLNILILGSGGSPISIKECFERCSRRDFTPCLRSVEIRADRTVPIHWENLKQPWRKLRHFKSQVDCLSESKINELLRSGSWERLRTLKLEICRVNSGESGLWLYDLVVFAQNCPALQTLAISLSKIVHGPEDIQVLESCFSENELWSNHGLENLEILPMALYPNDLANGVFNNTMKDALVVSRFIFELFCDIRQLTFSGPTNMWFQGVNAMVDNYRAIRAKYNHGYELYSIQHQ
ncbi:hypothetical protein CVT25_001635 [Psilocybe cyanescens]|uniref:F-box domain-containing protein n=1 Tax=Psilocybe cyanescens TaxID=93625 RepID=A0A409WQ55_PSICY|nr:hypothetical protein CVT25_001635 [Psilocybe cyanescens]